MENKCIQWYKQLPEQADKNRIYTHKELVNKLKSIKPQLSESTYNWALGVLVHDVALVKLGYDSYSLSASLLKNDFVPNYSDAAKKIVELISKRFPHVSFVAFETLLMNDFLNHLISQNTIFLQVEKESSIYVFRFLQEHGYTNVMYKPSKKEFDLYWVKNCIVVADLISESPLMQSNPHSIVLEKMLVDIVADKLISGTYSKDEFSQIIKHAKKCYSLDKRKMLRYARRRNKEESIEQYLKGEE